jgi:hypothetical protein
MSAATPIPTQHVWYSPADIAAMLDAAQYGGTWRAACPAHGGSNRTALGIAQGRDKDGNPMTLLHCFASECSVEDICAALGIQVKNLFCIHPTYAHATRHARRARSPRIHRLRTMPQAASPDEIAQILLEEMIMSDPAWIAECAPARKKMWELAQASPNARALLTDALHTARLNPARFWDALTRDMEVSA